MINADLAQSLWDEATDDVSIDGVGRTTIYHRFALAVERELLKNTDCTSEARCDLMRLETTSENIARDMREGRFPQRSAPQMIAAPLANPSDKQEAAMRLETTSENIARDIREGRFPQRSEPQMIAETNVMQEPIYQVRLKDANKWMDLPKADWDLRIDHNVYVRRIVYEHVHKMGGNSLRRCMTCGFDFDSLPDPPYTDKGSK